MKEAMSVGIIGGADGPTAVFVTGNPIAVILAAAAFIAVIGFVIWKLRKK